MKRRLIAASAIALVAATSPTQTALTEKQMEGVETTIKAIGCTVEDSDITTKGGGYKADDVECKDGQYDLLLDKDFKITKKKTKRTNSSSFLHLLIEFVRAPRSQ